MVLARGGMQYLEMATVNATAYEHAAMASFLALPAAAAVPIETELGSTRQTTAHGGDVARSVGVDCRPC
eukprot:COSAG01_NODE_646_length_14556_cov_9.736806_13_plen_69_part_00